MCICGYGCTNVYVGMCFQEERILLMWSFCIMFFSAKIFSTFWTCEMQALLGDFLVEIGYGCPSHY